MLDSFLARVLIVAAPAGLALYGLLRVATAAGL